jgi:hypothetical protein
VLRTVVGEFEAGARVALGASEARLVMAAYLVDVFVWLTA